jgi:proteasome lid subunit RPN8/RPN11
LSADDIQFEEVSYREPERLRRPDLDREWACIAYEVPGPDDLPIFLDRKPADLIERHALRDTSVELGGILLGKECVDEETGRPFVWITEAIEAKHYENTQASFTYTHDSWQEITRERDQKHPELDIVGWYHTHPDFGIFLSSHDLFIHHNFFDQKLQVAYVVDPIRQIRGFFQWRNGEMEQVGGFHISAPRQDRQAVARLVNDLENFPNTEGGGGSLSPRLEAELIAMLTRPHQTTTIVDRTQTAAVFSLIGLLVGFLIMIGGFWIYTISQSIRDQTLVIKTLEDGLKKSADRQSSELTAERVDAKERALDQLLHDVRPGTSKESFIAMYTKVSQERDSALTKMQRTETANAALLEQNTKLDLEKQRLQKRVEEQKDDLQKADLEQRKSAAKHEEEVDDLKKQLSLLEDSKAGRLAYRYNVAWYVAALALAGCVLLGLGLISVIARVPPEIHSPPKDAPHTIT